MSAPCYWHISAVEAFTFILSKLYFDFKFAHVRKKFSFMVENVCMLLVLEMGKIVIVIVLVIFTSIIIVKKQLQIVKLQIVGNLIGLPDLATLLVLVTAWI